ncbi:curlin, partial [Vibrio splendidus]
LINQNTSGVTDGHVALVNTHASYKSDVVIEQSGNLNEAHAKIRGVRNNALIDQDGLHNQARVKVQRGGRLNDLRVTQMGDENISVVKAKGGADRNEADVYINGNSNTTYTEFSNSSVDRNDVDIDLMNSNDNRIFTLQTGSYSNATVDLTNSNMNQLMVEQTSYDNAVVLGNGANGNVGLIYQN